MGKTRESLTNGTVARFLILNNISLNRSFQSPVGKIILKHNQIARLISNY